MNVNDKIKQILIDKSLSPSVFADEIGVQRSSISHILSGRNRPSFDIIQKVIRRFPDLGYDWIMEEDSQENHYTAKQTMPIRSVRETSQPGSLRTNSAANQQRTQSANSTIPTTSETGMAAISSESPVAVSSAEKTVERILIFYKDGTFREYTPAGST